jgi:hypothetical protein
MDDFPVAAGCWIEMMVRRESGDLGRRTATAWKRKTAKGELQAGEKEG